MNPRSSLVPRSIVPAALAAVALATPARLALALEAVKPLSAGSIRLDEPTSPAAADSGPSASQVAAQGSTPAALDQDALSKWTVRIEPKIWYAAPSGKLRLPQTSDPSPPIDERGALPPPTPTDTGRPRLDDLDADRARIRPAGDIRISAGDWLFSFSGAQYEISRDSVLAQRPFRLAGIDVAAGDPFQLNFELGLYELSLGYRVWQKDFQADSAKPQDAVPVVMNLYVLGGVRFYDVTIDFRAAPSTGQGSRFDDLLTEPLLGARLETALTDQFGIEVQTSVGYLPGSDTTTFSVDVVAGFYWRPTQNLGLVIGYRQLAYDLEQGDGPSKFEYQGRLAGLFTGVEIRF